MTSEKTRQFLERLVAAGEDGIENNSLDSQENTLVRELIHDGEAAVLDVSSNDPGSAPKRQFVVARYGAHHRLYVARGWAKPTRDGLTITEEGSLHLKLVPLTKDDI